MAKTPFMDIANLTEDQRCHLIGHQAADGKVVGFVVEDSDKADRYLAKIKAEFPQVIELERVPGPVPNTILVRVGLPSKDN